MYVRLQKTDPNPDLGIARISFSFFFLFFFLIKHPVWRTSYIYFFLLGLGLNILSGVRHYACLLLQAHLKGQSHSTCCQMSHNITCKTKAHTWFPLTTSWHASSAATRFTMYGMWIIMYSIVIFWFVARTPWEAGTVYERSRCGSLEINHQASIIYLAMTEQAGQNPISWVYGRKWGRRYSQGWAHSCELWGKLQLTFL